MSWNYRVVESRTPVPDHLKERFGEEFNSLSLHEVYYDKEGKENGYKETPVCGYFEDIDELIGSLELMTKAAQKVKDGKGWILKMEFLERMEQ